MKILLLAICMGLVFSGSALADEKRWNDVAEFSYIDTSGNSDVTMLSAQNLFWYKFTPLMTAQWEIGALYGESDNTTTVEDYYTKLRSDYAFSDKIYAAVSGGWIKNTLSGFDPQVYVGPLIGYRYFTGPRHFLDIEGGMEYTRESYTDDSSKAYARSRLHGRYRLQLSEKIHFSQSLTAIYGFDDGSNYRLEALSELVTILTEQFALKTSYNIRYNHKPIPSDLRETDTFLKVILVVQFN